MASKEAESPLEKSIPEPDRRVLKILSMIVVAKVPPREEARRMSETMDATARKVGVSMGPYTQIQIEEKGLVHEFPYAYSETHRSLQLESGGCWNGGKGRL